MLPNILLVDDSSTMRQIVKTILSMSHMPVQNLYEACNGLEAYELLEKKSIQVVLLDLNMPVMNGEQLIEKVRGHKWGEKLPIVVLSTETSQTRILELQKYGVYFLQKPFHPKRLREFIEIALQDKKGGVA